MSLYKDASLVMIPTAYKDGKLYSIRPIPEYGSERIINGSFDTDSGWTKGTGWTISGGTANCDGTQTGTTNLNNTAGNGLVNGKKYRVVYTISSYASGSIRIKLGNSGYGVYHSANGTYTQDLVAGVTTFPTAQFNADANFVGSIDNVSVKEVLVSGDFTFSRGSNLAATRVVNGLIEKGRENLLLQSNQFDTTWLNDSSVTHISGQSGYDGSNDAWLISKGAFTYQKLYQDVTTSGVWTFSIYAKEGTLGSLTLRLNDDGTRVIFNLDDGSVYNFLDPSSNLVDYGSSDDLGSGWRRYHLTYNGSLTRIQVYPDFGEADAGNIYIQDSQLESGLVSTSVIETGTSAAQSGILEDMPRLDYSGSCPSLLLEPQRTNICPNSEDVSNWYLTFATATPNDTISPEGVQNAAKIVTSSAGCDVKLTSIPVSASTTYTATFYCKLTSGSGLQTRFYDNTNGANIEYYDYSSQLVVGEWKRVERTFTTPVGCNNIQIWFLAASSSPSVTAHYWGYQLEQGSYPTSYIPTYGSSVTRSVDTFKVTGISDLIDTQGGVMLLETQALDRNQGYSGVSLSDDTFTNNAQIRYGNATDQIQVQYRVGSSNACLASNSENDITNNLKIAFKYEADSFKMFVNGVLEAADTSGSVNAANTFDTIKSDRGDGGDKYLGRIKQLVVFPTALTDSECIALTTL